MQGRGRGADETGEPRAQPLASPATSAADGRGGGRRRLADPGCEAIAPGHGLAVHLFQTEGSTTCHFIVWCF